MVYLKEEEFFLLLDNCFQEGVYTYSLKGYKRLLQA
jgi:hypothetical protein